MHPVSAFASLVTSLALLTAQGAPVVETGPAPAPVAPPVAPAPVAPADVPAPAASVAAPAAPALVSSNLPPAPNLREAPATPLERRARAGGLAREGRHFEAALEYEGLWRELHEPPDLLGAAGEREALGHRAHAAAYLRELLRRGAVGPELAARAAALEQGLAQVKVRVRTPEPVGEIPVRAKPRVIFASDARPELVVQTPEERSDGHEITLLLDPGLWDIHVDDPAYEPEDEEVRAVPGKVESTELVLRGRGHPENLALRRFRVRASTGVFFGVGLGLLIGGQVQYGRTLRRSDEACSGAVPQCRELLSRAVTLRSTGTAFLGVAVGGIAAGLVELAHRRRTRQVLWASEAGVGALGILGGALGVAFSARAFNAIDAGDAWQDPAYRDPARRAAGQHSAAAFFLGLGTGLFVHSVAHLIQEFRLQRDAGASRKDQRGRVIARGAGVTIRF